MIHTFTMILSIGTVRGYGAYGVVQVVQCNFNKYIYNDIAHWFIEGVWCIWCGASGAVQFQYIHTS